MGTVLKLTNVRLSFPKLDIPDYYEGKKQKDTDVRSWNASFHILNDDPQRKAIDAAYEELAKAKFSSLGPKWKQKLENLRASDSKTTAWIDGMRKNNPVEGVWILSAKRRENDGPPIVVDNDMSPIYDRITREVIKGKEGRLFAGCYVNAQVDLWVQDGKTPGLRCGLLVVQRLKAGEAFGGGAAPNMADFEEVLDGADADDMS